MGDFYLNGSDQRTGELWQAVLWPETVERIKAWMKVRPEPDRTHKYYSPEWESLVFLSSTGLPVNMDTPSYDKTGKYTHTNRKDILKAHMRKVLIDMGEKYKGLNFGAWRLTFETLASTATNNPVADLKKMHDAFNRTGASASPARATDTSI